MRHRFKDYFRFNRSERKGIFTLLFLIIVTIIVKESLIYFNPEVVDNSEEADSLISLLSKPVEGVNNNAGFNEDETINNQVNIEYFEFDPNKLSRDKWMKLGLSKKQADVIINYREKGGKFYIKKDVQKMYTISDEVYEKLEPYILLPEKRLAKQKDWERNDTKNKPSKKWKPVVVNINLADSTELQKVYGIGPYFAGEIVKKRELLGGYYDKKQLLEIWGFSDSMLVALDSNLEISQIKLEKINVNSANANELKEHPYISWNIANSIVSIREQHGVYQKLEDIKKSVLIGDSLFVKISPYLKLSD